MEQYNGIINALSPKFASSYDINILNPLYITDLYDVDNTIILAKYSELYFIIKIIWYFLLIHF